MAKMKLIDKFALKSLPEVMRQYSKIHCPMITYNMDNKHVKEIAEGAYNIAFEMLEQSKNYEDEIHK